MTFQAKARFSSMLEDIQVGPSYIEWKGKKLTEDALTWQPPVTGTVYGTLLNFTEQVEALQSQFNKDPYKKPPIRPIMYIKPKNTFNAHLKEVAIPEEINEVEINATLGIIIGKTATNVKEEEAYHFVEGYTIVNDVSIPHDSYYRPAIKQKARDGFCPIGPWLVGKEHVVDPDNLLIRTFKNDELIQVNHTKELVRSIPRLIQDVTEFMTLYKGDVLLVGVPYNPPKAIVGDTIRIEIDQIGSLENQFVMENVQVAKGEHR
ncbi:fumarylacetoacetate hydrolase family protein [Ornithinibacillus halotolerans]|uniref:Fumarylacetoacetase-like C-terminal domain-containing protein n=1 Tax=Ornithinibacillus halotolerans TaxID=1274357 RepID=A0A916RT81_9BACI|nr:fumarylacetoacetate hydrolase family protein [Ornithinibacillus halotolerans]GGA66376.1 hypothetical protein GCM10008025_07750 [Ornithinibacillus halotolerans]